MPKDQDSFELALAVQTLAARVDVQGIALQEVLRVLSRPRAEQCATAIRARVAALAGSPSLLIPQVDEAIAGELANLQSALGTPAL